jgi:hypothetical protein
VLYVVGCQIRADPSDINILAEYDRDPRVVGNLLDGHNRTRDDMHMWLAPFTAGKNHYVYLTFDQKYSIALIRIWVTDVVCLCFLFQFSVFSERIHECNRRLATDA